MDLTIRQAEQRDISYIYNLNKAEFNPDLKIEQVRENFDFLLQSKYDYLAVCEDNWVFTGYIHIRAHITTFMPELAYIVSFAVKPEYRDYGIGKALLTHAENWAIELDLKGVTFVSGYDREKAHGFYRALGYTDRKDQKSFIKYF